MILLLESKSSQAVFAPLNSSLTINMRFKILFELMLIIQVVYLSLLEE